MREYKVIVNKKVFKSFRKVPEKHARQIQEALERLRVNPHPQDSKKLQTSEGYRLTVGEYRILYTIDEEAARVVVYVIAKRNDYSY